MILLLRWRASLIRFAVIFLLCSPFGCSRSTPLESDQLNCGDGVRVFSQNASHCAYTADDAPEACPTPVEHRFQLDKYVVCSSRAALPTEWLAAIVRDAWPPDAEVPPPPRFSDGALIGTVIENDGNIPDQADATTTEPPPTEAGDSPD